MIEPINQENIEDLRYALTKAIKHIAEISFAGDETSVMNWMMNRTDDTDRPYAHGDPLKSLWWLENALGAATAHAHLAEKDVERYARRMDEIQFDFERQELFIERLEELLAEHNRPEFKKAVPAQDPPEPKPAAAKPQATVSLNAAGKPTYTVPEFCFAHSISRTHLYKLINEGKGPRLMKIGRRTLITAEAAEDWVKAHQDN